MAINYTTSLQLLVILMRKLNYGVGINDADYFVYTQVDGKRDKCPYFNRWEKMLRRCYSENFLKQHPTYRGVTVCDEWLTFSNFKAWMMTQNWEGKVLDKDILAGDKKIYSPETAVFVTVETNNFYIMTTKERDLPHGISFDERWNRYHVRISQGASQKYIGWTRTKEEAIHIYRKRKYELAIEIANKQTDKRVKQAILEKYKYE